jgi:hypothetical protein
MSSSDWRNGDAFHNYRVNWGCPIPDLRDRQRQRRGLPPDESLLRRLVPRLEHSPHVDERQGATHRPTPTDSLAAIPIGGFMISNVATAS